MYLLFFFLLWHLPFFHNVYIHQLQSVVLPVFQIIHVSVLHLHKVYPKCCEQRQITRSRHLHLQFYITHFQRVYIQQVRCNMSL